MRSPNVGIFKLDNKMCLRSFRLQSQYFKIHLLDLMVAISYRYFAQIGTSVGWVERSETQHPRDVEFLH
jgi:hypothetical protein